MKSFSMLSLKVFCVAVLLFPTTFAVAESDLEQIGRIGIYAFTKDLDIIERILADAKDEMLGCNMAGGTLITDDTSKGKILRHCFLVKARYLGEDEQGRRILDFSGLESFGFGQDGKGNATTGPETIFSGENPKCRGLSLSSQLVFSEASLLVSSEQDLSIGYLCNYKIIRNEGDSDEDINVKQEIAMERIWADLKTYMINQKRKGYKLGERNCCTVSTDAFREVLGVVVELLTTTNRGIGTIFKGSSILCSSGLLSCSDSCVDADNPSPVIGITVETPDPKPGL